MIDHRLPSEAARRRLGLSTNAMLARGMEATCYHRDADTIIKIYDGPAKTTEHQLRALRELYDSADTSQCSITVPRILDVMVVEGLPVTVERKLRGENMLDVIKRSPAVSVDQWIDANIDAICELMRVRPAVAASGDEDWLDCLRGRVTESSARLDQFYRRQVDGWTHKRGELLELLAGRYDGPLHLIHGDFGPFNLLVDEAQRPTAIIDFGLFSMWGDWHFDLAVAPRIFDMWDEMKVGACDRYRARVAERFGRAIEPRLALYALVYSVIATDAYDPGCTDGHSAWCAANLNDKSLWRSARG